MSDAVQASHHPPASNGATRLRPLSARLTPIRAMAGPLFGAWATASAAATEAAPAISAGGMLQVVLGLLLVLGLVFAVAKVSRHLGVSQSGAGSAIKVISGAAVGGRERVVVVEVAGTWLVLGVAPGQVRTLHTLPKGEIAESGSRDSLGPGKFPAWLKQFMDQRNGR
jgi:flagellar protein FliO/FliZ